MQRVLGILNVIQSVIIYSTQKLVVCLPPASRECSNRVLHLFIIIHLCKDTVWVHHILCYLPL